ncbi:uncharacterized protein LOC100163955 isoform X2 [Acyrthosiphon pisum]|uniref:Uncharacterized protein n=1 Tax=Acyrthosiphon pisum TaxID=7029 RepID=A0A8R2JMA9_ACYPI|nr:uncharacterized protein LOC100163955 isoform X2 [Acyrthosiphon pisum]
MHISLGLLWLCFQIIHGEIIRCPMGGLDQEDLPQTLIDGGLDQKDLCQTLIDDSVFNKFYNRSFQRKMKPNSKYMYDVYDNPYYNFEENTKEKAITWTPAVKHYLMLGTTLNSSYRDTLKMGQSIIVDDDDQIDTQWNDVLSIGTDTYRLKYHNILSNKYYKIETNISSKEFMVVVQSYYNAASTHYFSRDYKTAQILIEEGKHCNKYNIY